ncbi:MAG: hypothetical protein EP344_09860 [Bacteroidetes bacterium]|nr:MAG: hypothetical protein EP344_09860 [Bacteroidota bacterium]
MSDTNTLTVKNAGLVLLAPFLPRYFATLQLLDGDRFRDAAAARRAVSLLEFLATGQSSVPEDVVVLQTILCGLPAEAAPHPAIELSPLEQKLTDNLLQVVLQNWEAMGNMGAEHLRAAFLTRTGMLQQENKHWLLEPARKPFDTLLQHLPWTLQPVRFPWMEMGVAINWQV